MKPYAKFLWSVHALVVLCLLPSSLRAGDDASFKAYTKAAGPGFAVLATRNGKILEASAYGLSNLKTGAAITADTAFNLASLSKQFTAMAILILESQGKLSVEDKASRYVVDLPSYAQNIRIKHLIHHTSGIPDYMSLCAATGRVANKNIIDFLISLPALDFESGTKYEYSNTGYALLAMVVEQASGVSFPEFVKQNIFTKLQMNHSWVFDANSEAQIQNRAIGYGEWPHFEERDYDSCNYVYGDGGIYTTLNDYAKWIEALRTPTLLNASSQKKIFASSSLKNGTAVPYGYGWAFDEFEEEKMIFHDGAWLGFKNLGLYFQDQGLWIIVLSNYKGLPTWSIAHDVMLKYTEAR